MNEMFAPLQFFKRAGEAQPMTMMRFLAAFAFVLAIVCRFAWRLIPLDLAYRVTPEVHRGVPMGIVLFWGLLALSAILALASFFRTAELPPPRK